MEDKLFIVQISKGFPHEVWTDEKVFVTVFEAMDHITEKKWGDEETRRIVLYIRGYPV